RRRHRSLVSDWSSAVCSSDLSIHFPSAYGPIFTLLTYPLSPLGVPAAFWILKVVAAICSLGIVALVWKIAQRLGREPLDAALARSEERRVGKEGGAQESQSDD